MIPHDRKLDQMFRELARAGTGEAPSRVEALLLNAFRRRRRIRRTVLAACGGMAASIAAALILASAFRHSAPPPPRPVVAHIAAPQAPAPVRIAPVRRRKPHREPPPQPAHLAAFNLLPGADAFAPLEYGEVVRMQLPRSVLRVVGLPVSQDRVSERIEADVLLGQDGLARAVRFIQ